MNIVIFMGVFLVASTLLRKLAGNERGVLTRALLIGATVVTFIVYVVLFKITLVMPAFAAATGTGFVGLLAWRGVVVTMAAKQFVRAKRYILLANVAGGVTLPLSLVAYGSTLPAATLAALGVVFGTAMYASFLWLFETSPAVTGKIPS